MFLISAWQYNSVDELKSVKKSLINNSFLSFPPSIFLLVTLYSPSVLFVSRILVVLYLPLST